MSRLQAAHYGPDVDDVKRGDAYLQARNPLEKFPVRIIIIIVC